MPMSFRGVLGCFAAVCLVVASAQAPPSDWAPRIQGAHMLFSPYGDTNITSDAVSLVLVHSS